LCGVAQCFVDVGTWFPSAEVNSGLCTAMLTKLKTKYANLAHEWEL